MQSKAFDAEEAELGLGHPARLSGTQEYSYSLLATGVAVDGCWGSGQVVAVREHWLKMVKRFLHFQDRVVQRLFCFDGPDAGPARLLWSGDLYRDGVPNFLLSASDNYYLSSAKLDDRHVAEAARFTSAGC